MSHALHVTTAGERLARIEHEAKDDRWSLVYDPAWRSAAQAFPLSPVLPLERSEDPALSPSVRRFLEHLLPEGRALDVAVAYHGLSKSNIFGLVQALGSESAGALQFHATEEAPGASEPSRIRRVPLDELDERIARREELPFTVWDGKVRMSVAGLQDKLLVYIDGRPEDGGALYLVDGGPLASTHILKPDTGGARTPCLAVNEHFCMSVAKRMGLPVAEVTLLRTPRPVLAVQRFDRQVVSGGGEVAVRRQHIVDACQVCDLPVSFKYERHLGSAADLRHYRDGVSFERLFDCARFVATPAMARQVMLRWALFQFLIGNSDAHGKNFSFYVHPGGWLSPTPWYDLVSVLQYEGFDMELAMAFGDVFEHGAVSPFALADFAVRCGVDRRIMQREGQRLASAAVAAAAAQAASPLYVGEERPFVARIAAFITAQADRLSRLVTDAAAISDDYL